MMLLACLGFACAQQQKDEPKPVSLIFDTDMAPDYDDVGAMAVLHALADSGKVNILATVSSNKWETTVPCIEVINTYFGRPDIPLGVVKGEGVSQDTWHKGLKWTEELPARYPHRVKSASEAEDAVKVYRRVLSQQP
ncbi:MAG TPA: nucleoside hydrolase, partial [Candidatus Alistipes pullicola]|nr:nucleoside hydrolase [Candidatus Alistipes pullicola]